MKTIVVNPQREGARTLRVTSVARPGVANLTHRSNALGNEMWKIVRESSEQVVATVKPDRAGRFRVEVHVEDHRLSEALAARPRQFAVLVGRDELIDGEPAHVIVERTVTFKASPDGYMLEPDTWLLEHGFRAVWRE